jgi:hypothetical protein
MPKQWHPYFFHLLRSLVEEYYEVQANVSVGDIPREADLVLLRRKSSAAPPFHGLWQHLTAWNVLEYKGPSVSARLEDIDLLVELGLGIHRKLKAERQSADAPQVSFWYIANSLGSRFLKDAAYKLGSLDRMTDGLWRSQVLHHPIHLVSSANLVIEEDSLPIHLLGVSTRERKAEVDRLLRFNPSLAERYREVWAGLHPEKLKEFLTMARTTKKGPIFHLMPLVDVIGWDEAIRQLGKERLVDELITDDTAKRHIIKKLAGRLSPAELNELVQGHPKKK